MLFESARIIGQPVPMTPVPVTSGWWQLRFPRPAAGIPFLQGVMPWGNRWMAVQWTYHETFLWWTLSSHTRTTVFVETTDGHLYLAQPDGADGGRHRLRGAVVPVDQALAWLRHHHPAYLGEISQDLGLYRNEQEMTSLASGDTPQRNEEHVPSPRQRQHG